MIRTWKPGLTVRAMQPVLAGLHALGHAVPPLLAHAGVSEEHLADPDRRLPPGTMSKLWDRAVTVSGDESLGIHVALQVPVSAFDVHAYAMLSSPTLRDAYVRACRYQRLINESTELTFTETPTHASLRHGLADGGAVARQPAEFLVTSWIRLGRLVTATHWTPTHVFFAHDRPADTSLHEAVFGPRVQFTSGQTALHLSPAILDAANPRADASLVTLLDRYASSLLERQPAQASVSGRVRAWLVEGHASGPAAAHQAASALAMSERTLHRRLAMEGTSFRKLLDRFRHEKALSLLTSQGFGIAEVAFLLGYSELSAFYRAFRRWTGRSPAELRDESSH